MTQAISIAEFATALAGNVVPADQSQRFFVATSEGNIYAFTAPSSHTSSEYTQEVFAHIDDALFNGAAAYTAAEGVQQVVAATMDGNVYHLAAKSHESRVLANFDGAMFSALCAYTAPGSGLQYAVVATSEGVVHHMTLQGKEVVQQQLGEFASGVITASGLVTPGDDTQHIFVAASDGYIHHFSIRPGQSAQQQVLAFFEESFISLTSYLTPDGLLNIVPATRDGKLYHVVYDASKVQETHVDIRDGIEFHDASKTPGISVDILKRFYQVNESSMMFIAGYATHATPAGDATQHVLVASSDGAITQFSFQGTAYNELKYAVVAHFQSMI
ncbi:MAG: hypothetical protein NVSMB44_28900 [Ktedonobacteraceae bacterium]